MCGYAPAEVIGKPFHDFVAESDRAAMAKTFAAITGKLTSFQIAAGIRRKDGAIIDVLAHGSLASYESRPAVIGSSLSGMTARWLTSIRSSQRWSGARRAS